MIGELTKGACSLVGAWGDAVAGGRLLQMRVRICVCEFAYWRVCVFVWLRKEQALDWDTQGPYKNYAAVMIYHPTPGTGMVLLLFSMYFSVHLFSCLCMFVSVSM
jgi:hypothetical protein